VSALAEGPRVLAAVCFLFLTYLVAAVPFGLLVSTLFGAGDADIRREGSGNIGATNVARVYGWGLAGPVLALDVAKGLVPVLVADAGWPGGGVPWLAVVAGVAFVGHVYPVYLAFHGGKGVATGCGAMLALAPIPTVIAIGAWMVVLAISGKSSVASLSATTVLLVVVSLTSWALLPVVLLLALGIVSSHVDNIRRLLTGQEDAIIQPVRWGRSADLGGPDPARLLEEGPAGLDTVVPAVWPER
jgi:glycerol-3-phosphate acyltransferase PlsY